MPALERFEASVVEGPVPEHAPDLGPCLLWLGAPTPQGYGVLNDAGKKWFAHRWAFAEFIGPIPEDFEVSHLCHTPLCVNAEGGHLIVELHAQNHARTTRLNRLLHSKPLFSQTKPEYPCFEGHHDWYEMASKRWACATCRRLDGFQVSLVPRRFATAWVCANGHAWTAETTYITPSSGKRVCRICNRLAARRRLNDGVDRTDLPLEPQVTHRGLARRAQRAIAA